jgi:hypothetical protein
MGVKASLLLQHEKTWTINGQEVTITYRRVSLLDNDRIKAATKNLAEGESLPFLAATDVMVVPQIVGWNLEADDDAPLPVTAENLCRFVPDKQLTELYHLIHDRLGGEAEQGEDPNPSTTPS